MKIVHLNTYAGNGGAGKACLRLNKALQHEGYDSQAAVNFLFKPNPEVHDLSARVGIISKWYTAIGIIMERLIGKIYIGSIPIPFSIPIWGKDISNRDILKSADIIHIHWINHAFLSPSHLIKLGELKKPIVWTFHDSNAFTGGCHVRYDCDHFLNECGNCPVLKDPDPEDMSHTVWLQKQKAYEEIGFSVIAPSRWMAESVKKSKLLGDRRVVNIPNTIDTNQFRPFNKVDARKELDLPADKFILLSGFMPSRRDKHKGTPYLIESVTLLIEKYDLKPEDILIVIFGTRDNTRLPEFPIPVTFLGTIVSEEKLAKAYSAADVFLAPSLEDNLPNTVMESMACSTPVVAFTTGGIPDMVSHKENGYLAEYRSSDDFAAGIHWVYQHPEREILGKNARAAVEDNFSESVIAQKHMDFYQSVMEAHGKS